MLKENISVNETIDFLNSITQLDRKAIQKLIENRVECNEQLARHPTVQTGKWGTPKNHSIGFLGILNGLFGIDEKGWGTIAAIFEVKCPNNHLIGEKSVVGDLCNICHSQLILGDLVEFINLNKETKNENSVS